MNTIRIQGRTIGDGHKPYIIAEMSANHNGKIENALKLITEAKKSGADAIKIQTYTPDTITLDSRLPDFMIESGLWAGQSLYELYKSAYTPWSWHETLFQHAKSEGITMFSSPFDNSAIDLLEKLNAPAYKIASFEVIDLPLIKYAASTGKPLIISTGMANAEEIHDAIDAARGAGCKDIAILHCVSGYPAPVDNYNLNTITDMIERYDVVTGLSDHTLGNSAAIASVALGATIIEKHFTLDRNGGGPDDTFSMEPGDLIDLVKSTYDVSRALGKVDYKLKSSEIANIKFRRSLYFVKDLEKGHKLESGDFRSVRPGYGISPKFSELLIGKELTRSVTSNTPVKSDCFASGALLDP